MEQWYLCKLRPLEEYFLGGERTFDFAGDGGTKSDGKTSYFIRSEMWPNQSTLLGILRFLVLKKNNKLINSYGEVSTETELIGSTGFDMSNIQASYGKIKCLSPIFLMDSNKHRWIRTPVNHKVKTGEDKNTEYTPMNLLKQSVMTDKGSVRLPGDYVAKEGLTDTLYDLDYDNSKKPSIRDIDDIFEGVEKIGIARRETDDGFFKKMYYLMKDDFSFAFYCKAEEGALPDDEVIYAGQGKSTFRFECCKETESEPIDKMKKDISQMNSNGDSFWYALSDVYLDKEHKEGYSIIKKKQFRSMEQVKSDNFRNSKKKGKLYELVEAGSVFYYDPISETTKKYNSVGLNHIVKIGGQNNEQ